MKAVCTLHKIFFTGLLSVGANFASAQSVSLRAPLPTNHACWPIEQACSQAGFVRGASHSGYGLFSDCMNPIINGKPQPRNAVLSPPVINPDVIQSCRFSLYGPQVVAAAPTPATPTVIVEPTPRGVVYVQPFYVAPGNGYIWRWDPRHSRWAWHHPYRGWYYR